MGVPFALENPLASGPPPSSTAHYDEDIKKRRKTGGEPSLACGKKPKSRRDTELAVLRSG